jgi:hypothetical protein
MDSEDIVRKFHQKRGRIRKKSIPDPDPGGKKAPDPGSATLSGTVKFAYGTHLALVLIIERQSST